MFKFIVFIVSIIIAFIVEPIVVAGAITSTTSVQVIRTELIPRAARIFYYTLCSTPECRDYNLAHAQENVYKAFLGQSDSESNHELNLHIRALQQQQSVSGSTNLVHPDWETCTSDENDSEICEKVTATFVSVTNPTFVPNNPSGTAITENRLRRRLHQDLLGAAALLTAVTALGLSIYAVAEVKRLRKDFDAHVELTQKKFEALQKQVDGIDDTMKKNQRFALLQIGFAAYRAQTTSIDVAEQGDHLINRPALAAALTADLARNSSFVTPVFYSLKSSRTIRRYDYVGLLHLRQMSNWLNILEYGIPDCLADKNDDTKMHTYVLIHVQEEHFPWAVSMYTANVYFIHPLIPPNPLTYKFCGQTGASDKKNTGCLRSSTDAYDAASWRIALYLAREPALAIINPITTHTSRASLHATWPLAATAPYYDLQETESDCPTRFDFDPGYIMLPVDLQTDGTCITSTAWTNIMQNTGPTGVCAPTKGYKTGRLRPTPPVQPLPSAANSVPSYQGAIDRMPYDGVRFRTIGVSNSSVKVNLLSQQALFYYNSSSGISKSPRFDDEWLTADGISVPEGLMQQYYSVGLTYGSQLSALAYVPTNIYTLPNTTGCANPACFNNRKNYRWNATSKTYGEPFFAEVIVQAVNPIPCDSIYDCDTVGSAAAAQKIKPVRCPSDALTCCNQEGYVCIVRGVNETMFGAIMGSVETIKSIDFQKVKELVTDGERHSGEGDNPFTYLDELIRNSSAIINEKFKSTHGSLEEIGNLAHGAWDVIKKAGGLPKALFGGLFSGMGNFIAMIIQFGVIFVIVVVLYKVYSFVSDMQDKQAMRSMMAMPRTSLPIEASLTRSMEPSITRTSEYSMSRSINADGTSSYDDHIPLIISQPHLHPRREYRPSPVHAINAPDTPDSMKHRSTRSTCLVM